MSFNVMGNAGSKETGNLIPKGALLFCQVNVKEKKFSQTGRGYFNLELMVLKLNQSTNQPQPYGDFRIFDIVMDPGDPDLQHTLANAVGEPKEKAEKTYEIATKSLGSMMEFARGASPENPDAYNLSDNLAELHGAIVGVRVGVEEDKSGQYPPKNTVAAYLSPNPNRQSHSGFKKLVAGDHNIQAQTKQAPAQAGFGNAAAPAPPAAAPQGGFGAPAPQAHSQPAQTAPAPAVGPGAAAPGWMQNSAPAPQGQATQKDEEIPFD